MEQNYNFKEEKIKSPIDGSENCFRVYTEPASDEHYLCMSSGYMASSYFKIDNEAFKKEMNASPELVKALQHYDSERDVVWIPTVLNMGKLGMIFPDGNLENWCWKYAKNVEISKEEQEKYPDPNNPGTFYKKRMDMKNMKRFDKLGFMDAAEELGMFAKPKTNENNKSKK